MQARYSSILILVILFVSLPFLVLADNAFCGCQVSLTSSYIAASPAVNYTSGTQCQQACYNMRNPTPAVAGRTNYRHSMFRRTDGTCYCTDKYPSAAYQSNGQPETCANSADWDNRIVQTTFMKYPDCYATLPANIVMSSIAGPDSCSVKCASSINFVFYMDPASNSFTCGCGTIGATLPATTPTCGPNTYFIYYHTVAQASQGLSRRSRLAQALAKSRKSELCPKGLTACRVNNGSELFECVDTESDVDSCGGCLYGSPGEPVKATGTDCYAKGTALSSATCVKGKCMVQKCKKNYDLVQGICVRRSSA